MQLKHRIRESTGDKSENLLCTMLEKVIHHFCASLIGQDSVTWFQHIAKEAGKCNLAKGKGCWTQNHLCHYHGHWAKLWAHASTLDSNNYRLFLFLVIKPLWGKSLHSRGRIKVRQPSPHAWCTAPLVAGLKLQPTFSQAPSVEAVPYSGLKNLMQMHYWKLEIMKIFMMWRFGL